MALYSCYRGTRIVSHKTDFVQEGGIALFLYVKKIRRFLKFVCLIFQEKGIKYTVDMNEIVGGNIYGSSR